MRAIGLIVEYNPFHNGHLYHLNKAKELYPNHTIIIVMSSHFMQRGETSIINKWEKCEIALHHGVDLVVELPFAFATQHANIFAKGAIQILNALQVEAIVFGSESDNIELLYELAKVQIEHPEYESIVKQFIQEGKNYPTATSLALKEILGYEVNLPNDILGLAYIKEILLQKAPIQAHTIKRTNDYHSTLLENEIASATSVRKALNEDREIEKFVPPITYQRLNQTDLHFIDDYFPYLQYKLFTTKEEDLAKIHSVDEGIEYRLKKYILQANNLNEFIQLVKSKRYTYNRIQRMLLHILMNFTKEEALQCQNVEYVRVLGFNAKGQAYLKYYKKDFLVPVYTRFRQDLSFQLALEFRATQIYSLPLDIQKASELIKKEYSQIIIK